MKKTTEEYYCDDCGRKTPKCFIQSSDLSCYGHGHKDLCGECLHRRLAHSMSLVPSIKCSYCGGKGTVVDFYYHNEREYRSCPDCHGTGFRPLPVDKPPE